MKKSRTAKLLALTLSLTLVLTLAGCGGGEKATALDLNSLTLDQIVEGAKKEGQLAGHLGRHRGRVWHRS